MRSLFVTLLSIIFTTAVWAQPNGYAALKDLGAFQAALSKSTSGLKSLQSDFVQTKHMAMLSDKITSKGTFSYRKEDQVRIEYTSPFRYLLVMSGGQILVRDEQKTTKINAKTSRVMQSVNRIMVDCMRGSVFSNPDFRVTAFEGTAGYLLSLSPVSTSVKGLFSQIDVFLDRTSLDVARLSMTEDGGDFTRMDFRNTRRNIPISDALFNVR